MLGRIDSWANAKSQFFNKYQQLLHYKFNLTTGFEQILSNVTLQIDRFNSTVD